MGLKPRTIMAMKWRTLFLAGGVLALLTLGPGLRREDEGAHQKGAGRQLLQEDGERGDEEPVVEKDCTDLNPPPALASFQPNCTAVVQQEGDDRTLSQIFKSAMKKYSKQHPQPGCITITCAPSTPLALATCSKDLLPSGMTEDQWIPDAQLLVTVDDCRTMSRHCSQQGDPSLEPYEAVDPPEQMFPPDLFTEEQRASGAIVCHILGILYMFYALALVCDHYFVPALDVIIDTFGISPDVAGATFMAAGGSAPELFTSIIGVFIAVSDVGIGTIVGSAVFNVLFVIAACAFASAEALKLTAWPLIRDVTFYSIALIVLVMFFLDDVIQWWEALILFSWYFAYVIFMKFNAPLEAKFLQVFPNLKGTEEEETAPGGFYAARYKRKPLLQLMRGKVQGKSDETEMKAPGVGLEGLKLQLQNGEDDESKEPLKDLEEEKGAEEEAEEEYVDYVRAGPGDGLIGAAMWFISLPLMIPMWISIPDPQDKARAKYWPLAFIMSIVWIAVFSYFMVWWATLTGQALGISDAVMGLTFLAAGTSVPDLITSVLVAKEGKGDMAVSSSIGSNLFDVTVGLPLPWLLYAIIFQKPMEVNSVGIGCSIGMLFVMLLLVFISIMVFKWEMTKPMGGVMLVFYVIFVIVSLGLSECWFICPF